MKKNTSRKFTFPTKPHGDERIFKKSNFEIKEGLTALIGCNGAGKSTLLKLIRDDLREKDIKLFWFDNLIDGGMRSVSRALSNNNTTLAATLMCSSEGESIITNVSYFSSTIGGFFHNESTTDEVWILIDAIDSGLSIDNLVNLRDFFQCVLDDQKDRHIYIVVSTNSYELTEDANCFDVISGRYVDIESYDDFKKAIMVSYEKKKKRYKSNEE